MAHIEGADRDRDTVERSQQLAPGARTPERPSTPPPPPPPALGNQPNSNGQANN
jgi:hypothetical protein